MHKKGGAELTAACQELFRQQRQRPTGSVIVTTAGALPARNVIHAIGPKWHEHLEEPEAPLRETYRNIFRCAESLQARTLSVPAISTGGHKYPKEMAAQIAFECAFLELQSTRHLSYVIMVSASVETAMIFRKTAITMSAKNIMLLDMIPSKMNI